MELGRLPDEELQEVIETVKRGITRLLEVGYNQWTEAQLAGLFLYKTKRKRFYDRDYYELDFKDSRIEHCLERWSKEGHLEFNNIDNVYLVKAPFILEETDMNDLDVMKILQSTQRLLNRVFSEGGRWVSKREFIMFLINSFSEFRLSYKDRRIQEAIDSWIEQGNIRLIGEEERYVEVLKPFPA